MLTSYQLGSFSLPKPKTEGPKEAPKNKKGDKKNGKNKRTTRNNRAV